MAEKEVEANAENLDEDGLVIHTYASTVLVIVPSSGYAETTLRYARSALYNVHVGTRVVASDGESNLAGELQDEFQADSQLDASISMDGFSGLVLCGGPGASELASNAEVLRLAREADQAKKLVAAWGQSVHALAAAGVVRKRKVTGDPSARAAVEAAGGRFTGTQIERDGTLVTAIDDAAGFRFGKKLVEVVGI